MVNTEELQRLLGEEGLNKPSLLIDKTDENEQATELNVEPVEEAEQELIVPEEEPVEIEPAEIEETKKYKCRYKGCTFSTDSRPELMTHAKQMHKGQERPPDIYPPKKKKTKEEKEREKAEKEEEKEEREILPESLSYLRNQLKAFSARNPQNVIKGMQDEPTNLELLRDLLVSSGTEQKAHPYIIKRYASYIGQSVSDDAAFKSKEAGIGDPITLLNKLRSDRIVDTMYKGVQLENDQKEIELEAKRKALKEPEKPKQDIGEFIEYNEPVYTEDGRPVVDAQGKQVYRKVKYNMNNIAGMNMLPFITAQQQPKSSMELELLRKEIEDTKRKMETTGSSEVNILKQQIADMERKRSEDERMQMLRDEARKDRELLEKRIEEQNKRYEEQSKEFKELIKTIAETKKPNTEETLSVKMMEMQKQYNEGLTKMQEQFQNSLKERETQNIFSQLKDKLEYMEKRTDEQYRNIKDKTDSQVGGVSEAMKDFATDMTHTMELYMKDKEKEKSENELKKKIEDIQRTASMSKEQLLTSKGMEMAESAIKGGGEALKSFGTMINKSTSAAAEVTSAYDRAKLALELKTQGFSTSDVVKILNNTGSPIKTIPSAAEEAAKLQENYNKLNVISEQIKPKPAEITPETLPPLEEKKIQFSTGDEK